MKIIIYPKVVYPSNLTFSSKEGLCYVFLKQMK